MRPISDPLRVLPGEVLVALDDHVAVKRIEFHEECFAFRVPGRDPSDLADIDSAFKPIESYLLSELEQGDTREINLSYGAAVLETSGVSRQENIDYCDLLCCDAASNACTVLNFDELPQSGC